MKRSRLGSGLISIVAPLIVFGCEIPGEDLAPSVKEGIWLDLDSGLEWQNPPPSEKRTLGDAKTFCSQLMLDGSGWRVPTIDELRTIVRGCPATESTGSCNIGRESCLWDDCRNQSCDGSSQGKGPGIGGCYWPDELMGECGWYLSSTKTEPECLGGLALVFFLYGSVSLEGGINLRASFRCVR